MLWGKVFKSVKYSYHLTHTVFIKFSSLNDFNLMRAGRIFQDGFSVAVAAVQRVLKKRCPESMQQIYRRTPMPMCDFNKVAL